MRSCFLMPLFGLVLGCKNEGGAATQEKTTETGTRKLVGVYPEKFQCNSIVTAEALSQMLGGVVKQIDSAISVPRGVPQPCNYQVMTQTANEYWTFDIDCRNDAKKRADSLMEQYKTGSTELVDEYNHLADAGAIKPTDAGIAIHAPEAYAEVAVGAKGLDHHGQAIIFVDDDAPCYVRVVGPEASRRLALAKELAKNLTFTNAPMTPRPMP